MANPEIDEFRRVCNWHLSSPVIVAALSLTILQVIYIANATYPLSATLIKLALLFQYLRVFKTESRYRVFCICVIAITVM